MALTGKESTPGHFYDLMQLRMEVRSTVLKDHMEGTNKYVRYTSVRIQNELFTHDQILYRCPSLLEGFNKPTLGFQTFLVTTDFSKTFDSA